MNMQGLKARNTSITIETYLYGIVIHQCILRGGRNDNLWNKVKKRTLGVDSIKYFWSITIIYQ